MNKISVIIPIYNVEEYLKKCLNSIINQTYQNIEIILINDGSRDTSGAIADSYKSKDARVIVIHKPNGGLSDARNTGLEIATGDYISFVDSDDYVSLNYFEAMVAAAREFNADIVTASQKKFPLSRYPVIQDTTIKYESYTKKDVLNMFYTEMTVTTGIFNCSACGKLFKKNIFDELRFPPGRLYEDYAIAYRYYHSSQIFAHVTGTHYYYLHRVGSITNTMTKRVYNDRLTNYEEHIEFLKGSEYITCVEKDLISDCLMIIGTYFHDADEKDLVQRAKTLIKKHGRIKLFLKLPFIKKIAYSFYKIDQRLFVFIADKMVPLYKRHNGSLEKPQVRGSHYDT